MKQITLAILAALLFGSTSAQDNPVEVAADRHPKFHTGGDALIKKAVY